MHKRIVAARKKRAKAEADYERVIAEVQKKCKHEHVVESTSTLSETPFKEGYFGSYLPHRLCTDCGFEEEAWHWPGMAEWRNGEGGIYEPTVLNNELVSHVSRDKFYSLRP